MPSDSDWRLQGQEKFLQDATLVRQRYRPRDPGWDHDHCEFCGAKFMAEGQGDSLAVGYATLDAYRWICERCFSDFHRRFGWRVVPAGNRLDDA